MCSRAEYLEKFGTLYKEEFQSWIETLLRRLHPNGDFCAVIVTRGDGGLDGYSIKSSTVYQIHAPTNDTDSDRANKITIDFEKAFKTTDGTVKKWVFIHNSRSGKLGHLATTAIGAIATAHPGITIQQWGREELWEELEQITGSFTRAKTALCTWNMESCSEFFVPALGIRLPISMAWNQVASNLSGVEPKKNVSIKQALRKHREWARLGDNPGRKTISAYSFISDNLRSILISGPGGGKSTLSHRLVCEAAIGGKAALRVSLKHVSLLLNQSVSFGSALREIGLGSTPSESRDRNGFVHEVDWLILDGLDETEPHRTLVAEEIAKWAKGHPEMGICVTTRAVGHQSGLLPDFTATELVPLTDIQAARKIAELIKLLDLTDEERARVRAEFHLDDERWIRSRTPKAVGLGIRNPLLLSFFVALAARGESLSGKRVTLYGKMIDLMRNRESAKSRTVPVPQAITANEILNRAANALFEDSAITADLLIERLAEKEKRKEQDSIGAEAKEIEDILQFWVEQGVLEKLQVSGDRFYSFAHPTLQEFCVARSLGSIDGESVAAWTERYHRNPAAREIFSLSGGFKNARIVVETLLEHDQPDDPLSDECVVALQVVGEMTEPPEDLIKLASENIEARMVSRFPVVTFEIAADLAAIATIFPEQVGSLCKELLQHPQAWTRLGAYAAFLVSAEGEQACKTADEFLSDPIWNQDSVVRKRTKSNGEIAQTLWRDIVVRAIKILSGEKGNPRLDDAFATFISNHSPASVGMIGSIEKVLGKTRFRKIVKGTKWDILRGLDRVSLGGVRLDDKSFNKTAARVMKVIAQRVLKALMIDEKEIEATVGDLKTFSDFLQVIDFHEIPIDELALLVEKIEEEAQIEIFAGLLSLHKISRERLAADCVAVLANNDPDDLDKRVELLFVEPIATREGHAEDSPIEPQNLVRAFLHPAGQVHSWAKFIIEQSAKPSAFAEPLESIFHEITGSALADIANLAEIVWKDDASEVIRRRIEKNSSAGLAWLLRKYGELRSGTNEIGDWEFLIEKIASELPPTATGAADGLAALSPESDEKYKKELRKSFEGWSQRELDCFVCKAAVSDDGQCPKCDRYPVFPFGSLIKELVRTSEIGVVELFALCGYSLSQKSEPAIRILVHLCETNTQLAPTVFDLLADSLGDHKNFLKACLESTLTSCETFCSCYAENYDRLDAAGAELLMAHLPSMAMKKQEASDLLRRGMENTSDLVRDVAAESLRLVERQEVG